MKSCEDCGKRSEQCVEVDPQNHPGLCFKSEFLDRSVAECFDKDGAGASEVIGLIGLRFDPYNSNFVDALCGGWITCEGRITASGRAELERKRPAKRSDVQTAKGNGGKVVQLGRRR